MKKNLHWLILPLLVTLAVSCKVNKDYDLEKPLNLQMLLARNLTFPIGDVGGVLRADQVMYLLGEEYIEKDADGHIVLNFTESHEFALEFDIKGIRMNQTFDFQAPAGISLKMDVENTSPFSFEMEVSFIDTLGAVVPEYAPIIYGKVDEGRPRDPSKSAIEVAAFAQKIVPFDGLRFRFHFRGGDFTGDKYVLTEEDTIRFRALKIKLPNGFPIEPDWIKFLQPVINVAKLVTLFF